MQMLETTHQSEECILWTPVKIWCNRRADSISWMPCAPVPWCEGSDSQQMTAAISAACLHQEAHPCDGNAEFVLPPSVSQLFVPAFLNLLIIRGGSRAAGAEWGWVLKQVTAMLGAMRTRNGARCIGGRSRNTDRSGQILALRKLSDHQELCKVDTAMWEASSDTNVGVRPPCDNSENNPCRVQVVWVRIPPEGLFQMGTLTLPCLSSRLVYLIVSAARCLQAVGCVLFTCCGLEREHSGSQHYRVCATCVSHQKKSWKYFILQNWEDMGLVSQRNVSLILGLSRHLEGCLYF